MIKLYIPQNEMELALLKSIFEAEGIPIYVHNDNYGSLKPGLPFGIENEKSIMVHEVHFEKAKVIMQNYFGNIKDNEIKSEANEPEYSFWDKLRMALEGVIFGRVIPGKWRTRKNKDKDVQQDNQPDGK